MISKETVAVLVPVYNEASHLEKFFKRLLEQGLYVLMVDDGSTDRSTDIARGFAVDVLALPHNQGKGAAIRVGIQRLLEKGVQWVIFMDGDGQHLPEEIPRFLEKAKTGSFDLINGNRMNHPRGMSWIRFSTNAFLSFLLRRITDQKIQDAQCGFKMISMKLLQQMKLRTKRFEIEDELILEAVRLKARIGEVPIQSVYHEKRSHIHPVRDTLRFFRFLLRYLRTQAHGR